VNGPTRFPVIVSEIASNHRDIPISAETPLRDFCVLVVTYRETGHLESVSLLSDWPTELPNLLTIHKNGGGDEPTRTFHAEDRVSTGRDGDEPFRDSTSFEDDEHGVRGTEGDHSENAVVRDETDLPSAPTRRTEGAGRAAWRTVGREPSATRRSSRLTRSLHSAERRRSR